MQPSENRSILSQTIYGLGVTGVTASVIRVLSNTGVVSYSDSVHVVWPVIEELFKSTGTAIGALVFGIVEAIYFYPQEVYLRSFTVIPAHVFWYVIGKRYGIIWSILLHMIWNYLATEYREWSCDMLYMLVLAGVTLYIKIGEPK